MLAINNKYRNLANALLAYAYSKILNTSVEQYNSAFYCNLKNQGLQGKIKEKPRNGTLSLQPNLKCEGKIRLGLFFLEIKTDILNCSLVLSISLFRLHVYSTLKKTGRVCCFFFLQIKKKKKEKYKKYTEIIQNERHFTVLLCNCSVVALFLTFYCSRQTKTWGKNK